MVSEGVRESMAKASLRAILDSANTKPVEPNCRTCRFVADLSPDDRTAFNEYLQSDVSTQMIRNALEAYGYKISVSALSRHRRVCPPLN